MINKSEKEIMKNWVGDISLPLVSIKCTAYNQEAYISEALDSFLMQETDFPFEIIIHDDASVDNTANIIKEYQNKFPNIIKPIFEKNNVYSKHDDTLNNIMANACKGKYQALCEGDDYWIDNKKLQKQVDYLAKHPDCSLVLTSCLEEFGNNKKEENRPFKSSGRLSVEDIILEKQKLPPTCSMIYPSSCNVEMPDFFKTAPVGDKPKRLYLSTCGYVYFMDDITCVHRNNVVGSFAENVFNNKDYAKYVYEGMTKFYDEFNEYTKYKYNREILYAKDKEEFYYYIRIKDKKSILRCNYFIIKNNLFNRIKAYIAFNCPEELKKIIKKILGKEND